MRGTAGVSSRSVTRGTVGVSSHSNMRGTAGVSSRSNKRGTTTGASSVLKSRGTNVSAGKNLMFVMWWIDFFLRACVCVCV